MGQGGYERRMIQARVRVEVEMLGEVLDRMLGLEGTRVKVAVGCG